MIEREIAKEYERDGWTVLWKGWPDLFMYREVDDGKVEIKIREVKGPNDSLSTEQEIILKMLDTMGLDARVLWTKDRQETLENRTYPMPVSLPKPTKTYEINADGSRVYSFRGKVLSWYPCRVCKCFGRPILSPSYICEECRSDLYAERFAQRLCCFEANGDAIFECSLPARWKYREILHRRAGELYCHCDEHREDAEWRERLTERRIVG